MGLKLIKIKNGEDKKKLTLFNSIWLEGMPLATDEIYAICVKQIES